MSDRLIRAEALRQRMYHDAFETDTEMQRWDGGCWVRYKMFENALEDAPTIDAETTKHGHNLIGGTQFECSACGYYNDDTTRGTTRTFNYCPHCGAKMDGDRKEDANANPTR